MDRANGGPGPGAAASRAERFEDEKRRIIESCFSKKDPDGSLQETYITHIRITEFGSHPATPPPPQARTPDAQKPRIIIIAVRKSGRVRMHKSKENANGTFSIGKTWNLDDLTHIESFTGPQVSPQHRENAGDTGFLVTLGKPYYWQAQTDKEKKFFIASMIKIYGKYTSGKVPELSGFDQKEYDQVMGAGKRPATSQGRSPMPDRPSPAGTPPVPTPTGPSTAPPPRFHKPPPVRSPPSGNGSPAGSFDSTASRERLGLRNATQNNKSQESVATSFANKSDDASSLPPRSRNGMPGPGAFGRFGEPREAAEPPPSHPLPQPPSQPPSQSSRSASRPRTPKDEQPPPERRRPPMDPTRPQDRDLVPPPLMGAKRDPVAPPPRSSERMSPRKDPPSQRPTPVALMPGMKGRETPPPALANLEPKSLEPKSPEPPKPIETPKPIESPKPREPPKPETPKQERPPPVKPPSITSPPTDESSPSVPASEVMSPPVPPIPAEPEEETRPGLGPMIKSKRSKAELAGAFRKAASAAAAFKPRPGGAGERLRQLQEQAQKKPTDEPDGITSVVPAPPRPVSRDSRPTSSHNREPTPEPTPPPKAPQRTSGVPEVKISVPSSSRPTSSHSQIREVPKEVAKAQDQEPASPQLPPRSIVAGNDAKYLQSLGIDPNLLDGRSDEFGRWLDYFGWVPGDQMRGRNIDDFKVDLERELNKAQAGGWLARFQEEDERVDAIKRGIDVAMTECEELDNLLTLYSVELSTLSEDIAYIEAQGQGLQVQTANQKLLKKELESLLETCAITSSDLDVLRTAPIDNVRGLEDVESSLVTLFRAMIKMDPSLGGSDAEKMTDSTIDPDQTLGLNSDYGKMRIVQEKKEMYMQESSYFMKRLLDFMPGQFDLAFQETRRAMEGALSKKVDSSHHEIGRDILWKYSPLMLYARDTDLDNWNRLIHSYQDKGQPVYKHEFQTVIASWRRNARKVTGEETELLLFTSQADKRDEGVATAARKLTVKRSQTLARALRSPLTDGSKAEREKTGSDSRSFPYEVFAGVLDDLLPLVEMEQNFVIDFFHATTLEQADFPDAVAAFRPRDRRGGDLKRHRLMEPDRDLARRVTRSMEVIFAFLDGELTRLMEWVIGQDPLQGVGVLVTVEKKMADIAQTNQDYVNTIFQKLHGLLAGRFRKFVDDQIRAIEDTKVKINKRKGVIHFIRVFPNFATAVENMLGGVDPSLPIRKTIDREYNRMLKSMFESLMVIARENPAVGVTTSGADPEDKEALNFHILLIENMNHFVEETDTRGLDVLEIWKGNAHTEYTDHMKMYLSAVMRRPLGKLLDHLENIEAQLQSGKSAAAIAAQPSNNKTIFNKVLGAYDAKEVRKGIDALKKRVDKHFGDADDPALSRQLVGKVLQECEGFYGEVENRIGGIITNVYGGDVLFEWPRAEVKAAFR